MAQKRTRAERDALRGRFENLYSSALSFDAAPYDALQVKVLGRGVLHVALNVETGPPRMISVATYLPDPPRIENWTAMAPRDGIDVVHSYQALDIEDPDAHYRRIVEGGQVGQPESVDDYEAAMTALGAMTALVAFRNGIRRGVEVLDIQLGSGRQPPV